MIVFFVMHLRKVFVLVLGYALILNFASCQKANPEPYGIPSLGYISSMNTTKDSAFTASVNGSSTMVFTPGKKTNGTSLSLTGTNSSYVVTITFPKTTGPGSYFFNSAGFSASIYDGSNTYVANSTYGTGSMRIDSISSSGRYYGSFNFIAELPSTATASASGNFSYL